MVKDHFTDVKDFMKTFRNSVSDFLLGHGDRGGKRKARRPHQEPNNHGVHVHIQQENEENQNGNNDNYGENGDL